MSETHETTRNLLDKLRAGLLDKQPEIKAQMEQAIDDEPELQREHHAVRRLIGQLEKSADNATAINNQLRLRRREVLTDTVTKVARPRGTWITLAAAASLLLALAVGWFLLPNPHSASNFLSAPGSEEISDLTDNLDFYVWLETRGHILPRSDNGI